MKCIITIKREKGAFNSRCIKCLDMRLCQLEKLLKGHGIPAHITYPGSNLSLSHNYSPTDRYIILMEVPQNAYSSQKIKGKILRLLESLVCDCCCCSSQKPCKIAINTFTFDKEVRCDCEPVESDEDIIL
ncbi:MAG: hypothetical protein GXO59_01535 [Dictyoglomi bacterium]|nr:hypothetical protein [Dictyoglomota bacterium]